MPAARKPFRKDFLNFFSPCFPRFSRTVFRSGFRSGRKNPDRPFSPSRKRNGIFSGSRIIFDLYFMIYQIYSSFSQHLVNKVL